MVGGLQAPRAGGRAALARCCWQLAGEASLSSYSLRSMRTGEQCR